MAILGIEHVQVAILPGGEERARWFYGGLLGLAEVAKPESLVGRGGCWFQCGAQQVHCGVEEDIAPTRRHPAFRSDDLDGLRARLNAAGLETYEDAPLPGFRRFYCADPFGNRIELLETVPDEGPCYDRPETVYRDYSGWTTEQVAADMAALRRERESPAGRLQAENALKSMAAARALIFAETGGRGIPGEWLQEALDESEDD